MTVRYDMTQLQVTFGDQRVRPHVWSYRGNWADMTPPKAPNCRCQVIPRRVRTRVYRRPLAERLTRRAKHWAQVKARRP